MKKNYKVIGIDCPACASKLEDRLKKIEGVEKISLNFMTQRMTLEADEAIYAEVLDKVVAMQKEYEPDWEISVK